MQTSTRQLFAELRECRCALCCYIAEQKAATTRASSAVTRRTFVAKHQKNFTRCAPVGCGDTDADALVNPQPRQRGVERPCCRCVGSAEYLPAHRNTAVIMMADKILKSFGAVPLAPSHDDFDIRSVTGIKIVVRVTSNRY